MGLLKITILGIGIIALLILSVSFPLSMFTGQHSFIPGKNVDCTRCHAEEAGNLSLSIYHSNLSCRTCHNTTFSPGQEAHAASIPRCIDCHTSVVSKINSSYEAHMPLFRTAENYKIRRGPNEACLMCHTNYSANITLLYYEYINYTIYNNVTSPDGGETYLYNIESVITGPQRSYTVEIKNEGGSTHFWKNISDISCVRCHLRIKLGNIGNSQGSQHAGDVNDTDAMYGLPSNSPYHPGHQNASYGGATDAYCRSCHKNASLDIYAGAPYYNYNLNSSAVHAALKLVCLTCHNNSGPYPLGNEPHTCGGHNSSQFFSEVSQKVSRRLVGDLCTGCHRYNNHAGISAVRWNMDLCATCHGTCSTCHSKPGICTVGGMGGGRGFAGGRVENDVYTEPKAAESDTWVYRSFP